MPKPCVVIGGSAGSIEVLLQTVEVLPGDLPAPILVVIHMTPDAPSRLREILGRRSLMPVMTAEDGMPVHDGVIYVAQPDRHLTVAGGRLGVRHAPRQNRHRPAIDPLFRSAARAYGSGVVAVVLSGAPGDGVSGATVVAHLGGTVLVHDPADALFPAMPARILADVPGARAVPEAGIAAAIDEAVTAARTGAVLTLARTPSGGQDMDARWPEPGFAKDGAPDARQHADPAGDGRTLSYGCPDCGGVLRPIAPGDLVRFRCMIGHEYESEALLAAQEEALEDALWAAVRGLEEKADLSERMAAMQAPDTPRGGRHRQHATDARDQADTIRSFLLRRPAAVSSG